MNAKKEKEGPIQRWGKKINWEKRVKAVCKPCWEIKYCPYGTLVEDFPLKGERDEKSCIICGHDCPVFYVAEPFTETKELRNINREIPRVTQFKVLKRENQICSTCGKAIKDGEYEFDHIIPWAKGGSSDEHNVRLLCRECNRKKGKKFEDEYLVKSVTEHVLEPIKIEIVSFILEVMQFAHEHFKEESQYPSAYKICRFFGGRKVTSADEVIARHIVIIDSFFNSKKQKEIKQKAFNALKYRWGFIDREIHRLKESAQKYSVELEELLLSEVSLVNRLGFIVKLTNTNKTRWLRL